MYTFKLKSSAESLTEQPSALTMALQQGNAAVETDDKNMLEVCIDSLESAINAVHGGADELEVCSSLAEGGLTPSVGLIKQITCQRIKVNVMIRCRTGSDFCYTKEEMDTMLTDIEILKQYDIHRFVFGALTDQQEIDEMNCAKVIDKAHPIPVTFHRAFDVCKDPIVAINKIINLGFTRLLTSGQRVSASHDKSIELIESLLSIYGDKIEIMPGAGVNADNARIFIDMGCKIVHSSCKRRKHLPKIENILCMGTSNIEHVYITDENVVRKLKDTIKNK